MTTKKKTSKKQPVFLEEKEKVDLGDGLARSGVITEGLGFSTGPVEPIGEPDFKKPDLMTIGKDIEFDKVKVDDRDQVLRAVLNKSFPRSSFVYIDVYELAKEVERLGLLPGKDSKRGITVK